MSTQTILPKFAVVVLDRGFVYVGGIDIRDGFIKISAAKNIRRWGTTRGLGQLALEGPNKNTELDECGEVIAPLSALVHIMTTPAEKWSVK